MRQKRQIAKLSKRQLGFQIGRGVLDQISNLANGVRDLVEKGKAVDSRTGQATELRCAPADIKSSWTPEQLGAVEEFISVWSLSPEEPPSPPKPPAPPKPEKQPRKKK